MADEKQLAILRQGVTTWNGWREKNPDATIDLSGANLIAANLSLADLRRANLTEADLPLANLSVADLSKATLIAANLSGANLGGANLSGANLIAANLREADLRKANLCEADLKRANLIEANLSEANLRGVSVPGRTDPDGVNLQGFVTARTLQDATMPDGRVYDPTIHTEIAVMRKKTGRDQLPQDK